MKRGKFESPSRRKYTSKVLVLVLAFLLVIGASVGGTLAWLQAKTENVTNTFTSAKLFTNPASDFTIWEHEAVEETDGTYTLGEKEVASNSYKILPGVNIPKDPTVDIVNLLENAYLYIKVEDTLDDDLSYALSSTWTELTGYTGVYVYENGAVVTPGSLQVKILANDQITVANDYADDDPTAENKLIFSAYMVQAAGNGADAAAAWANTYGK